MVAQTCSGSHDAVTAASFGLVWVGVLLASGQGLVSCSGVHFEGVKDW